MFRFIKEKTGQVNWGKGTKRKSYEKEFDDGDVVKKHRMQLMTKVKMVLIQFFVYVLTLDCDINIWKLTVSLKFRILLLELYSMS